AFGDDVKAEELLQRALLINPTGIDANYFYGDFLAEQGRTDEARKYLLQAQQAPARPQRAIADAGRQQEIALLLENLK
ncbi:tetratricopeptide repeat protein, partial [Vibrio anguillarum]